MKDTGKDIAVVFNHIPPRSLITATAACVESNDITELPNCDEKLKVAQKDREFMIQNKIPELECVTEDHKNNSRQSCRERRTSAVQLDFEEPDTPSLKSGAEAFRLAVRATGVPLSDLGRVAASLSSMIQKNFREVHDDLYGNGTFAKKFSVDDADDTGSEKYVFPSAPVAGQRKVSRDGFTIDITESIRQRSSPSDSDNYALQLSIPRVKVHFKSNLSGRSLSQRLLLVQHVTYFAHTLLHKRFMQNKHDQDSRMAECTYLSDAFSSFSMATRGILLQVQRSRSRFASKVENLMKRDESTYLNSEVDTYLSFTRPLYDSITNTNLLTEPISFNVISLAVIGICVAPVHTSRIAAVVCRSGSFIPYILLKLRELTDFSTYKANPDALYLAARELEVTLSRRDHCCMKKIGIELNNFMPSLAAIRSQGHESSNGYPAENYFNAMVLFAHKTSKALVTRQSAHASCVPPILTTRRLESLASGQFHQTRSYFFANPNISLLAYMDNADVSMGTTDQRNTRPHGTLFSMTVLGFLNSPARIKGLLDCLPYDRPRFICITPGSYYGSAYDRVEPTRRSATHRVHLPSDLSKLEFVGYDFLNIDAVFKIIPELKDIACSTRIPAPLTCDKSEKEVLDDALETFGVDGIKRALRLECPDLKFEPTRRQYKDKQRNENPTAYDVNTVTGLPASTLNEMVLPDMAKLLNLFVSLTPHEEKGDSSDAGRPVLVADDLSVERVLSAQVMQLKVIMAGFSSDAAASDAVKLLRRLCTMDVDHDRLHQVYGRPKLKLKIIYVKAVRPKKLISREQRRSVFGKAQVLQKWFSRAPF